MDQAVQVEGTGAALESFEGAPATGRWRSLARSLVTQESVITLAASIVVAAAVLLPLATLIVSSFRVLDDRHLVLFGFGQREVYLAELAAACFDVESQSTLGTVDGDMNG